MSNLSNIGFNVESEDEFFSLVERAYNSATRIKAKKGNYVQFCDPSGAELWMQTNSKNELIGANPHYHGKSRRNVCLTATIDRKESPLDGAYHGWADPAEDNNPESGAYPFVFDVPDHKIVSNIVLPQTLDIQLSAFAQEFSYYESETAFSSGQEDEPKWAAQSFVPSGLFNFDEEKDSGPPEALGIFAGVIKESEKKTNQFTEQDYYWMLVDTLGGEIDVVADLRYFDQKPPQKGGVVHGQFWLSGRLLSTPQTSEIAKKGFFQKLFGR